MCVCVCVSARYEDDQEGLLVTGYLFVFTILWRDCGTSSKASYFSVKPIDSKIVSNKSEY